MASGSQTWSGNWADFPTAPQKISNPTDVAAGAENFAGCCESGLQVGEIQVKSVRRRPNQNDSGEKAEVAEAIGEEGFFGGVRCGTFFKPEPDQQVAAKADQFPEDEHLEKIIAKNNAGHGEGEQAQAGEKPAVAAVAVHVADGENVDEAADAGDDEHHEEAQRINVQSKIHVGACRRSARWSVCDVR